MSKVTPKARQLVQALLMSEDWQMGQLMFEMLTDKKDTDKVLAGNMDDEEKIFLSYVLKGDLQNALATANDQNKICLERITLYQKLQALLACDDLQTRTTAYDVLSGRKTIEAVLRDAPSDKFLTSLLNNEKNSNVYASEAQSDALNVKQKTKLNFEVNTAQNLHRLHYIMLDQKLTLDQTINTMIKAFYETIRADDYAELMTDEQPQNWNI